MQDAVSVCAGYSEITANAFADYVAIVICLNVFVELSKIVTVGRLKIVLESYVELFAILFAVSLDDLIT